ncbi:unnamed protein product [Lactuca saligna]|uniref:Secreted protein n=1 Tax=Lactuca saligna TaxID=75948 RepID=A0AA35V694_LACSI|nr:unnamed protein product [Lactuca saligna]
MVAAITSWWWWGFSWLFRSNIASTTSCHHTHRRAVVEDDRSENGSISSVSRSPVKQQLHTRIFNPTSGNEPTSTKIATSTSSGGDGGGRSWLHHTHQMTQEPSSKQPTRRLLSPEQSETVVHGPPMTTAAIHGVNPTKQTRGKKIRID